MRHPSASPITCSGCGSSSFAADHEGVPICDYCGTPCASPAPSCPECGTVYDPGARRCCSCGALLVRECPVCATLNPLETQRCVVCDQTLDATDALFARLTTKTPDQLRRLRETGAKIKAEQERASRARSVKMWADENRRREERASASAKRERQDWLMITLAIGLVVMAIVLAVIIAVSATGSAPIRLLPR